MNNIGIESIIKEVDKLNHYASVYYPEISIKIISKDISQGIEATKVSNISNEAVYAMSMQIYNNVINSLQDENIPRLNSLIMHLIFLYWHQEGGITKKRLSLIFSRQRKTIIYAIRRSEFSVRAKMHQHHIYYYGYIIPKFNHFLNKLK
jgi:hypothetical protein